MSEFESPERIAELMMGHLQQRLTEGEKRELESWIYRSEENRLTFIEFTDEKQIQTWLTAYKHDKRITWNKIVAKAPELRVVPMFSLRRQWLFAAAAVFILVGGAVVYYWLQPANKNVKQEQLAVNKKSNDVAPGTTKATLTLSNGQTVVVDNSTNGTVAQQGHATVVTQNGQLIYKEQTTSGSKIEYNTLTTRRGEQYPSLVLGDGSKIWLDAESSITYPVAFTGDERSVTITGEAYFEVAKNRLKPFIVTVNGMKVEVLGTHFNINAYNNEASIKTTLLEGSVKVRQGANTSLLSPGQQAQVNSKGEIKLLKDANTAEAVAWKNGELRFNSLDMPSILRIIERWYNVAVQYDGSVNQSYNVIISRNVPLSKLLEYLQLAGGVHCKIEGNKVIVTK